jgi:hypothetical protein
MGFLDKMKDAANQATKTTGMGTGMGIGDQAAYQKRAVRLNQSGVNHPATVKTMSETGNSDPGGGKEIQFQVEVQPANANPYAASFMQFMVEASLTGVAEGSEITVRVDPDDPNTMMFWGAGAP